MSTPLDSKSQSSISSRTRVSSRDPYRGRIIVVAAFALLTMPSLVVVSWWAMRVVEAPPAKLITGSAIFDSFDSPEALIASEMYEQGRRKFIASCTACHTEDGRARPNLSKDIAGSEFVRSVNDDTLAEFIRRGRDPGDPLNTTGIGMPPKGGNPALRDGDIDLIVAYIRGLQARRLGLVPDDEDQDQAVAALH